METLGEITYRQNGCGRSGHALKDIFTAVILSELFNLKLVADASWQNPLIRYLPSTNSVANRRFQLKIEHAAWGGVSKQQFLNLSKAILKHRSPDVLIVLSGVCRIHLYQVDGAPVFTKLQLPN